LLLRSLQICLVLKDEKSNAPADPDRQMTIRVQFHQNPPFLFGFI